MMKSTKVQNPRRSAVVEPSGRVPSLVPRPFQKKKKEKKKNTRIYTHKRTTARDIKVEEWYTYSGNLSREDGSGPIIM